MPTNIPYANYGLADSQSDAFTQVELFFGDTPAVVTEDAIVPEALATAGIAAWTPVRVDPATRVLALADPGGDPAVLPNAITVVEVAAGTPANAGLSVYTAGHFNIHAINWQAGYTTDGAKRAAFAESPYSQIRIGVPVYNQP